LCVKKPQDGCRTDNSENRPGKSHKDYDLYIASWNVENDLRVMKIKRWQKKKAQNREEWASVIKEAKVLKGP
jgi:hypothetical protein